MKYAGMPMGMWILFRRAFRNHLVSVLGFTEAEAARTLTIAKPKYREIIGKLPEFEKADRFKMNIVNCAMLSAFVLSMKKKHTKPGIKQSEANTLTRFHLCEEVVKCMSRMIFATQESWKTGSE